VKEIFMKKQLTFLSGLALFAITPATFACSFNTDCSAGSICLKASGSIYGACVGGLNPGNSNDRQPVYDPLDINGTYGNTCSFDTDCGPGSSCVKAGGIQGTCLK